MADAATADAAPPPSVMGSTGRKRKLKRGKPQKSNKKRKPISMASKKPKKPSQKMLKLFRKRARDYHSDEEEDLDETGDKKSLEESSGEEEEAQEDSDDAGHEDEFSGSDDEVDGAQQGITKFTEGCRAFRTAFRKIMKKHLSNDPLGPILSANKKLVAEKLAEEVEDQKVKGEAKKEKRLAGEKGHVMPANFLDAKEKFLISVATKGVVKLFNAVNKAQNPQKGLNPSRAKDAKELAKRRKQAFLSEIQKPSTQSYDNTSKLNSSKFCIPTNKEDNEESGWAPLRDTYMLTSSKLKDWDKMADPASIDEPESRHMDSSSDEE
ncbi:Ribosomal RNA-processing protein 15 [Dioscorea alata]|uniref:Ribosomal RNA-processing protein 15 n=1 Tax=Dioscorea alata TaxID=55571 RepID=A0ACB7UUQ4_DIOAL|nr:Ribosomal RNA-processing protein 15 [Dioscorea alata]